MSDAFIINAYDASYDTRFADASYFGAVTLVETGPNIDMALAKDAEVTVYDCRQNDRLTLTTSESLTLEIAQTDKAVQVRFNVSAVVDVDYVDCRGQTSHFSGTLALTGDFTFKPGAFSCADLSKCCSGGSFTSLPKGAFTLNVDTALWFADGADTGTGALVVQNNLATLFSSAVEGRGAISGDEAIDYGTFALVNTLAPERASDPFEGFGGEDDDLLRAIGDAAQAMLFSPNSEAAAKAATTQAMWGGLEYVFDYTAKAMAAAAVAPTEVQLASASDSGLKGDGLTNDRTLTIDGVSGKYAAVSIFDGDRLVGTGRADASGAFHVTTKALADGGHTLTAVATDSSGVSARSDSFQVTVDTQGPAAPSLSAVGSDGVAGSAEAGTTVAVYDGRTLIGATVAGADGKWSLAAALDAKALHSLTASASDAAGNAAASGAVQYGSFWGALAGGFGDDALAGSNGTTLIGGWGRDLFIFDGDFGRSTVSDFKSGTDRIQVDADLASSFADVKAHAAQTGADVTISFDAEHVIVLKHVALNSLGSGDFLFG